MEQNVKRARSDSQKADRKQEILQAAGRYVLESGPEDITMNGLARRAGLAKGTLYLYFRTKEEVLLELFAVALSQWREQVADTTPVGCTAQQVIDAMLAANRAVPLFVPLFARLATVIEANLSNDALIKAKRHVHAELGELAKIIADRHGLTGETAVAVALALGSALQGAAQSGLVTDTDPADLPQDVQDFIAMSAPDQIFANTARLILKGAGVT